MEASRTIRETARDVLRRCGIEADVLDVRPLSGGMVSQVELWETDGDPAAVVCKRAAGSDDAGLRHELKALRWTREHTEFPVPEVYGLVSGDGARDSYLVLERLGGRNLGAARLSVVGLEAVHRQMAEHLGRLHSHRGERYGSAVEGEGTRTWLEWFGPRLEENYRDTKDHLSGEARASIEGLLGELTEWLPEANAPTVVHGDLWHTNVMVEDEDPDHPVVTGYIDGGALYADVEYELAYVRAFGMVGQRFLDFYSRWQPVREGFERRCRVYWLNTMLLHVWLFGAEYLDRTERIAREIAKIA